MAPSWASSPAAQGGAPLRGILEGWRTELTGAACVFQLPKKPHMQRQSNPLLQYGLGLTREVQLAQRSWMSPWKKAEQQPAVGSCIEKGQTGTELC